MKKLNPSLGLFAEFGTIETLEQAFALYKSVGMRLSQMSQRTRIEYENDLADLLTVLEHSGITKPHEVTLAHLRIYLADLERRSYKASTCNRKTYAIKGFFNFLHEYALTKDDVAKQLIPPPVERGEPRFLSEAEYTRLLHAAQGNVRDSAILELFLQTGLRLSELVNLSIRDVSFGTPTGVLRVKREGGHAIIPLNHKAQNALREWLEDREPVLDTALFLTALKKPMGKRAVQLMLEKYLREVGIDDASVQSLRHTMIVHHLARGTNIKTLSDILGDQVESLEVYLSAARKVQARAIQEHAL